MAKVQITLGERKFWVTAAVLESAPRDLLLGVDCKEQFELFKALKQTGDKDLVHAVVTCNMLQKEQREQELDDEADLNELTTEFDFDDSLFEQYSEKQNRNKKTRREKRFERLQAFANSAQEIQDEVHLDRQGLAAEQKADDTLQKAWIEAQGDANPSYVVQDDLLYHVYENGGSQQKLRLVVPKKRRQRLVKLAHTSPLAAHLGRKKTTEKLQRRFYWPGLTKDVRDSVRQCMECQRVNLARQGKAPLVNLPVIMTPFDRIAIDIIGPLPLTE